MAVFKCKMCGGNLDVTSHDEIVKCDYCGTTQTIAATKDEKIIKMYNRGNDLRNAGEFDKAYGIFEQIIAEDSNDAEAFWNLVLCKYGVTYVDDYDGSKKPTINRMSNVSILEEEDYLSTIELAVGASKDKYIAEATEIAKIQDKILDIVNKNEPYDIFISYKETDEYGDRTQDSILAQDIYNTLTKEGYRVFLARVSLSSIAGSQYEPYIYSALYSAKAMILVSTNVDYVNAVWVKNEWARFLQMMSDDSDKMIIPCYKDMDPYDLPKELRNIQGLDMGKLGFVQDLLIGINKVFNKTTYNNSKSNVSLPSKETIIQLLELKEYEDAACKLKELISNGSKDPEVYLLFMMASNNMYASDYSCLSNINGFKSDVYFTTAYKFADNKLKNKLDNIKEVVNTLKIEGKKVVGYYTNDSIIKVPDGVFEIADEAFKDCSSVEEVILPPSVKKIGTCAFFNCTFLTKINLENVVYVGGSAFANSGLKEAVFGEDIKVIESYAFSSKNIEKIVIPNKVIQAPGYDESLTSYESLKLKYVKIPTYLLPTILGENCIVEFWEGETVLEEEQNEYSIKGFILPSTMTEIRSNLISKTLKSLVIKAEDVNITAQYFLQTVKLENIEANVQVLNKVYSAYPHPEEETRQAINKALKAQGARGKIDMDKLGNNIIEGASALDDIAYGASVVSDLCGACYVATCVYGSYDCPEVWTLRRFRDDTLASTWYGRAFIHLYYAVSPTIVKYFGETKWFKKMWRGTLDKMVSKLQSEGVESTPYKDKKW